MFFLSIQVFFLLTNLTEISDLLIFYYKEGENAQIFNVILTLLKMQEIWINFKTKAHLYEYNHLTTL